MTHGKYFSFLFKTPSSPSRTGHLYLWFLGLTNRRWTCFYLFIPTYVWSHQSVLLYDNNSHWTSVRHDDYNPLRVPQTRRPRYSVVELIRASESPLETQISNRHSHFGLCIPVRLRFIPVSLVPYSRTQTYTVSLLPPFVEPPVGSTFRFVWTVWTKWCNVSYEEQICLKDEWCGCK